MKSYIKALAFLLSISSFSFSQSTQKNITHYTHSWVSINSSFFINNHFFVMADVHLRENNFFASNSFIFGRIGLGYQLDDHLAVVAGYANLLLSPTTPGLHTKADENRIFQQVQLTTTYKKIRLLQRIRNEQRWQSIIVNDSVSGKNKFTDRVRYLLNISIPVFKKNTMPQLVLADECMLQFGKDALYNTFEQNRIFLGIKQKISNRLSFDAGYMRVFQQKSNGSGYNLNDTYRLFFYYTTQSKNRKT